MQSDSVGLAIEDVFVGDLLVRQMHGGLAEDDSRVSGQGYLLPAEHEFAYAQDSVDDSAADRHAEQAFPQSSAQGSLSLRHRQQKGADESGHHTADGELIGDD